MAAGIGQFRVRVYMDDAQCSAWHNGSTTSDDIYGAYFYAQDSPEVMYTFEAKDGYEIKEIKTDSSGGCTAEVTDGNQVKIRMADIGGSGNVDITVTTAKASAFTMKVEGDLKVTGTVNGVKDIQPKVSGTEGQVAGFDADGNLTPQTAPSGVPSRAIVMWSGAVNNIPSGWLLCNGQNGTPDLRDRFIVGAGSSYSVGATGGSNTVTLTVDQMPYHDHTFTSYSDVYGFATSSVGEFGLSASRSAKLRTDASGGSTPHENRPPYYALCFIMKQ